MVTYQRLSARALSFDDPGSAGTRGTHPDLLRTWANVSAVGDAIAAHEVVDDEVALSVDALDPWIEPQLRLLIEDRFWAPIERLTSLEAMVADPSFLLEPGAHLGLYSDHGPNHARDVALRAASISEWAIGTLVADRGPERRSFITGVAVLLSLIHDVGMCVDPPVGRKLHAAYATQLVFCDSFADVLDQLLSSDAGRLASGVRAAGVDEALARTVACEVLACALAHSKSTVPARLLDDRAGFRTQLQYVLSTDLAAQLDATDRAVADDGSFAWLDPAVAPRLADDVIDAVRIMRAADALRQRGTTLRTSAGFEVVLDGRTGQAAAVLRSRDRRSAYLLEVDSPIVVGEANIRGAEIDPHRLEFQFHRGALATDEMSERVADCVAHVIDDIQLDILPTFPATNFDIELVAPDDDPSFAERVRDAFVWRRPELRDRVVVANGVAVTSVVPTFDWCRRGRSLDVEARPSVLANMVLHGMRLTRTSEVMFADVVVVDVEPGDVIMSPGEAANFVIVPMGPGVAIAPLGGYQPMAVEPWIPVGTIGVLRGHARNSTVTADQSLEVLVIPDTAFLARWAEPFDGPTLVERVTRSPLP